LFGSVITGSSSRIHEPTNIATLAIAIALIPAFALWMHRQERLGRPAIIPNSIWRQSAFTVSCFAVFLTWGAFKSFGYFATLLYEFMLFAPFPRFVLASTYNDDSFQDIQNLSALQTSLRLLPTVVCGVITNVATGFLVKNTEASYLVAVSSVSSAISCALMAIVKTDWSFWQCAFIAVFLSPMSSDGLFPTDTFILTCAHVEQ
jgi:hypothetical protein